MSIDRVSNMLSSIKNAAMTGNTELEIPYTKVCESIAKVLKDKDFLSEVKTFKPKAESYKMLHLELSKDETGGFKLKDIKRVSKPGRRIYSKYSRLGTVAGGYGILIISTPRGIMEGAEARKKKLGGELICKVL